MSGDLKWNKIMGACLGTAFVILVVQQVSGMVYSTKQPEKMGYFVDAPEESAGGEAAPLPIDWGTVLPTADLAAGEAAFARCQACHNATSGGADGIGPNLFGVIGRTVGTEPDFAAYGDALKMIGAAGRVWDEAALTTFVADPAARVKEASGDPAAKSKMTFKLAKGGEDVAAYLASLN